MMTLPPCRPLASGVSCLWDPVKRVPPLLRIGWVPRRQVAPTPSSREVAVQFRHEYLLLTDLDLSGNWGMKFEYDGPHLVSVELRGPTTQEVELGHKAATTWCTVRSEQEPPPKIRSMFESLAKGFMPKGSAKAEGFDVDEIDAEGRFKYIPFHLLPDAFRSFSDRALFEHSDHARRTVRVLRWRHGTCGSPRALACSGSLCSLDGIDWMHMPEGIRLQLGGSEPSGFLVYPSVRNQVEEMVRQGTDEPIGHELFGEAWEQLMGSSRSALIMGMAAVEAGFKQCVATLVPDAAWLADNLPSPPIERMLREYLPGLPVRLSIDGKPPRIPEAILAKLKEGTALRNRVVHVGASTIDGEKLVDLLIAIRDVLWILDYCCGQEWALSHLSWDTKRDLGLVHGRA